MNILNIILTPILTPHQRSEIRTLWNNEYPLQLQRTSPDLENWLNELKDPSHLLLADEQKRIMGWYVDFDRDDKKWFVLLLHPRVQGRGYGTQLLDHAKKGRSALNGWVIDHNNDRKSNGDPYRSPLQFYLKNNFVTVPEERMESKGISTVRITWKK